MNYYYYFFRFSFLTLQINKIRTGCSSDFYVDYSFMPATIITCDLQRRWTWARTLSHLCLIIAHLHTEIPVPHDNTLCSYRAVYLDNHDI